MEITPLVALLFIAGIALGWVLKHIISLFAARKHKKELEGYKSHLERHMKITDEGNKKLGETLEKLKSENENLRISVQTLSLKPGRSELRLLDIYDSAIRKMMLRAPGFSSAWEVELQEAEREYENNEKGLKGIIKKVFKPSISVPSESTPEKKIEHKKE